MSKRKSQTAVADYVAQGFLREALVNYFAFLGWSPGHRGGRAHARRDRRALRARQGPEGRRPLRPGAPRVAQRPVDPPPGRRGPGRAPDAVPRGGRRSPAQIDRLPSPDEVRALLPIVRERLPTLAVDRGRRWASCGSTTSRSTRRPSCPSAGTPRRRATPSPPPASVLAAHDAVTWEADELEPPLRALVEARGWKAGDLFMAIRVADDREDRHAAAVRHAGRARPRPDARPPRRGDRAAWRAGLSATGRTRT